MIKEDFVQAKRHVLAVLRVQTGRTLYDVLVSRPEEVHEQRWLQEVYRDIELEKARAAGCASPPTPVEAGYQIESIRSCVPPTLPWSNHEPLHYAADERHDAVFLSTR
jgi:Ras GTPase-activating-like protein IQGAP2/3